MPRKTRIHTFKSSDVNGCGFEIFQLLETLGYIDSVSANDSDDDGDNEDDDDDDDDSVIMMMLMMLMPMTTMVMLVIICCNNEDDSNGDYTLWQRSLIFQCEHDATQLTSVILIINVEKSTSLYCNLLAFRIYDFQWVFIYKIGIIGISTSQWRW